MSAVFRCRESAAGDFNFTPAKPAARCMRFYSRHSGQPATSGNSDHIGTCRDIGVRNRVNGSAWFESANAVVKCCANKRSKSFNISNPVSQHRLSRPQTAKKRKKPVDPTARERDLALLLERCKSDVQATRAAYANPRLRPLLPEERQVLLADAKINDRGICGNVPFLEAAQKFAIAERNAINTRLNELTSGVITSVNQVTKIVEAVNACGHDMTSLNKRALAATLGHQRAGFVKELLELRQRGAFASTTKFKKLLGYTDAGDHRIRSSLRIYGGAPGRWSSLGSQLHNLPRNDAELPSSLVAALIAGDRAELARWGNPLKVTSGISPAALCAAPVHTPNPA